MQFRSLARNLDSWSNLTRVKIFNCFQL